MVAYQIQIILIKRIHTVEVEIAPNGELPDGNPAYDSIRNLPETGFSFKPRELIHAIGCKTACLPSTQIDECLKSAYLYTHILDLSGQHLRFIQNIDSDLQTARSQEIGIGMICLCASKYFGISWDQLNPLPGRGKRFDYRGRSNGYDCIFESKGTKYRHNQGSQIEHGFEKKQEHHDRGEFFDVELIMSTHIGQGNDRPRILIADPDKESLKDLYEKGDDLYHRLKHFTRVFQYSGLTIQAYHLNRLANLYLKSKEVHPKWRYESIPDKFEADSIICNNDRFLGNWYDFWVPKGSSRYNRLFQIAASKKLPFGKWKVFQGLREDIFRELLSDIPSQMKMLSEDDFKSYRETAEGQICSVFPDGSILVIDTA